MAGNAFNPGGLQLQIPPGPPLPEIEIEVVFQGERLPGLVLYIEEIRPASFAFTGDYKLNGVRGQAIPALKIHDVVRAEIAKEYDVPPGTFILLNNFDVNRAVYGLRGHPPPPPLKKKEDMEGGRKRRRRKTRKTVGGFGLPLVPNPPEIEIDAEFQGEAIPNLKIYIAQLQGGPVFTGNYKLNGVRGNLPLAGANTIHDMVRAEIAKKYVVPPGTVIMLHIYDLNKAVYGVGPRGQPPPPPLKKKDDMDEVEGGRKRRTRKTRRSRRSRSRSYRYLKV